MYLLAITSVGPIECAYSVGKFFRYICREAAKNKHDVVVVEKRKSDRRGCYSLVVLKFEDSAKDFCEKYSGLIKWNWCSKFRPYLSCENWFHIVYVFEVSDNFHELEDLEVTEIGTSARILHKRKGIIVEVSEGKTFEENKKIGLLRLVIQIFSIINQHCNLKPKQSLDGYNLLAWDDALWTFEGDKYSFVGYTPAPIPPLPPEITYEIRRQIGSFWKPIFLANFKYGVGVRFQKTIIFKDYYALRVFYTVDGVEKRGDFKMTDEGEITPIILPKKEWNYGPYELMEW